MTEDAEIRIEIRDQVLVVTIDRPSRSNALRPLEHHHLGEVFDDFEDDKDLRISVITGQGSRAFCAGSDIKQRIETKGDDFPKSGFAGLTERFGRTKPIIAAINGDAIGGGLEIVLACDLAISVDTARFGLPEPRLGLAALGGLPRLARHLPRKAANWIALTGGLIEAQDAQDFGLINASVSRHELWPAVQKCCDQIVGAAPLAIAATMDVLDQSDCANDLASGFRRSSTSVRKMLDSQDAVEGQKSFVEKRTPKWRGL